MQLRLDWRRVAATEKDKGYCGELGTVASNDKLNTSPSSRTAQRRIEPIRDRRQHGSDGFALHT